MGKGDNPNPQPPQPIPVPPTTLDFRVVSATGEPIVLDDVVLLLTTDTMPTLVGYFISYDTIRVDYPNNYPLGWGCNIKITKPGYKDINDRITLPSVAGPYVHSVTYGLEPIPVYPTIVPWVVSGKYFTDPVNGVRSYRCAMGGTIFGRYQNGEDVRPFLKRHADLGFNFIRVFGPLDWLDQANYRTVDWTKLDYFFTLCEQYGLSVEWVPITTRENRDQHKELVVKSFDVARNHFNVFIEIVNEPRKDNKCDPVELLQGVNRSRPDGSIIPTAYGLFAFDGEPYDIVPYLDYVTYHDIRDYPKVARSSKNSYEMREGLQKPVSDDEPIGFNEVAEEGRRTNDIDCLLARHGISMILHGCFCHHSEYGLNGRLPNENEPLGNQMLDALGSLMSFIPHVVCSGAYSAGHLSSFPIDWEEEDSIVTHAYASIIGNSAYVVNPMPSPGFVFTPINGWRMKRQFNSFIAELER